jgi:hypothetical protein
MSTDWIFAIGTFVSGLCIAFVVLSTIELRRLGREADDRRADPRSSTQVPNAE